MALSNATPLTRRTDRSDGVSAALHGLALFGFNRKSLPKTVVAAEDEIVVDLVMPDLKDLEEPEEVVISEGDEPPVDAGLSVPMLADVPMHVDLSTAFLQPIDYSSLVSQQNITVSAVTIPTNIHRGGRLGEGMGKIFDLKDLDRAPEPIVRIAPVVPVGMRQAGLRAEMMVEFIVDVNGAVVNPQVVRSTDRKLDEAALTAIAKWKFKPGVRNGRRVNVRMLQPLVMNVTDD